MTELTAPIVVCAFEGWNDAGDAATGAVEHLESVFGASPVSSLDPEDYYDFQVNRPTVAPSGDGGRTITWPTTRVSSTRLPSGRELVLIRGIEPNIRWRAFTAELVGICTGLRAGLVVALGALLADAPHTRPIPISGTSSDPALRDRLDLSISAYEGPTGIVGVFTEACLAAGLSGISLWAAVPHYVAQPPCPKATLALLARIEDLLDTPVPLGDLPEDARAWQLGVDELAAEDTEVADYVRALEDAQDTAELPEASGEAIAQEFERYLRRRGND